MTVSRVAVASRLPRQLIKICLRSALILIVSLTATASIAVAQRNSSRPVARMIASGAIPPDTSRPRVISSNASRISVATASPAPAASSNIASLERRAFDLVNAQRRSRGQQPLAWDAELARLARSHSEKMARSDVFDHTEVGGVTMVDRARAQGIRGWSALGENIAYNQGYDDPAAFVAERWMVSYKHRENLLNSRWTRSAIGVAIASDGRVFFTQVFIAP